MKKIKNIVNFNFVMNTISVVMMLMGMGAVATLSESEERYMAAGVTVAIAFVCFLIKKLVNRPDFKEAIVERINEVEGLQCMMDEESIIIKQGDTVLQAQLIERPERGSMRVHFMCNFAPQSINDVMPEGWAILVAECNKNYDYTTVKYYGDHFCCQVETTVRTIKDFVREYKFALDQITETLGGLLSNAPIVEQQYPIQRNRIGFKI